MLTIRIVGPGCQNCENLFQMCMNVAAENNIEANIQKITDREKYAELGIWMTPGLIVNGKVLSQGKIPTKSTIEHWLKEVK
ncbi:MAG: thioredoxin family protein [Ignavibacteria bacterium]|nr:thioredoxin family protein [Ignavibacteria bacterium]